MFQRTYISLTSHHIFVDLNVKTTQKKWKTSLPSSEGGSFWNWFQFGGVFQDNENRVHRTRASFWGQREHNCKKRGPHSTVWNVLRNSFRDTAATIPPYGMCEDTALETLQSHSVQVMREAQFPATHLCCWDRDEPAARNGCPSLHSWSVRGSWKYVLGPVNNNCHQ